MMTTTATEMRATRLPANFYAFTEAELDAAIAIVRSCKVGDHALVFGVEVECVRRGWFQIVGGLKHHLRSANVVRLIANMPSLRQEALCRRSLEVSREMFGA